MQKLSDQDLIKSLSLNIFYPRDLPQIEPNENGSQVLFSAKPADAAVCYFSSDLDELGYMRRYSAQRLFYYCKHPSNSDILKASVYGCDGLICHKISSETASIARGAGLHLALEISGFFGAFSGLKVQANIIIGANFALPKGYLKGEILCNI